MSRAAVLFAQGLEECEGLIVVDILRRAGIHTDIISIGNNREVVSSHDVHLRCDLTMEDADFESYDVLVLPGGMPGTRNLQNDERVISQVRQFHDSDRMLTAICAAPVVFGSAGISCGKKMTVHPKFQKELEDAVLLNHEVVVDEKIITGWGLGAAIPFALKIVELLCGRDCADSIRNAIGYIH